MGSHHPQKIPHTYTHPCMHVYLFPHHSRTYTFEQLLLSLFPPVETAVRKIRGTQERLSPVILKETERSYPLTHHTPFFSLSHTTPPMHLLSTFSHIAPPTTRHLASLDLLRFSLLRYEIPLPTETKSFQRLFYPKKNRKKY